MENTSSRSAFSFPKIKYLMLIFILTFALILQAQTISNQKSQLLVKDSPQSAGMSEERLARIDALCETAVSNGDIPGAVALVARQGKIVYHKAFGMADNQSERAMNPNDIFRIASQSKAITATAVMILWEEGKFNLDDPISKYIPEFKDAQVLKTFQEKDTSYTAEPADKEITIRHLLTHTSGIGYGMIDEEDSFRMIYQKAGVTDLFTTENISIGESVRKLAKLPLHNNPGEKFVYSEGLDVLGYFVEIVSGEPFDVYLRKHIFDPLGMDDTWFYLPDEKTARLVPVQHKKDNDGWTRFPVTFYDPDYPIKGAKRFFSGGAGLSSTVKDYATFLQMYLNGGELNGIRILSRTTVQTIMANHIGDLWGEDSGSYYGLAFGVMTQKGQDAGGRGSIGTFDWGGYFNTSYFADPQEEIIGLLFVQTQDTESEDIHGTFRRLVGQAVDD